MRRSALVPMGDGVSICILRWEADIQMMDIRGKALGTQDSGFSLFRKRLENAPYAYRTLDGCGRCYCILRWRERLDHRYSLAF